MNKTFIISLLSCFALLPLHSYSQNTITVSDSIIEQDVFVDQSAEYGLTIENSSQQTLNFTIKLEDLDEQLNKQEAGDLIKIVSAPNDMLVYASAFDNGNLWTSDVYVENMNKIFLISQEGELLQTLQIDWANGWIADIEANGDSLYMLDVNPSGDNGIKLVDKNTGDLLSIYHYW